MNAYDLYLRALPLVQSFRQEENRAALEFLNQAVALDPTFAPALANAAWCYELGITRGWRTVGGDDEKAAAAIANRAISTGTDDAVSLVVAGFVLGVVGREWDGGLEAARRAVSRNSGSGFVSLMASLTATFAGNGAEGLALAERAMTLNPLDPAYFHYLLAGAFALLFTGRPEKALTLAQRSLAIYPHWDTTFYVLAVCYVQLGRLTDARNAVTSFVVLLPGATVSRLRQTLRVRNPAHLELIVESLRKAGLPD